MNTEEYEATNQGSISALVSMISDISSRRRLPADLTETLINGVTLFSKTALRSYPRNVKSLRDPSMHHDGTPIQLSASLSQKGTGGVRITIEPGDLSEPVSMQMATIIELIEKEFSQLGWEDCISTVKDFANTILPDESKDMDTLWGGMWLGIVAHPRYVGIRVYFNLRSGDPVSRWLRIGRLFSALSSLPVCPSLQEIVLCASELATPVGIGLDLIEGHPHSVKVYIGVPEPTLDTIRDLAPQVLDKEAFDVLTKFIKRLESSSGILPSQSITVAYDVPFSQAGTPENYVRRYKVDADVSRIMPSDAQALDLVQITVDENKLQMSDLDTILDVMNQNHTADRLIQYVGLGLAKGMINLNIYIRPNGFSLIDRIARSNNC